MITTPTTPSKIPVAPTQAAMMAPMAAMAIANHARLPSPDSTAWLLLPAVSYWALRRSSMAARRGSNSLANAVAAAVATAAT